ALSEHEDDAAGFARREQEVDLERTARIQSGAAAFPQFASQEGVRARQRSVATDEFRAIARERTDRTRRVQERYATLELLVVSVARENRPGLVVHAGRHESLLAGSRRTETPFDVAEHVQVTRPRADVLD